MRVLSIVSVITSLVVVSCADSGQSRLLSPSVAHVTKGQDVSSKHGNVDWFVAKAAGSEFAYIRSTMGLDFIDPRFEENYAQAAEAGLLRGAYHVARPDKAEGYAQAEFFLGNGGHWSRHNATLPGAVQLTDSVEGESCFGRSKERMAQWISDFGQVYLKETNRYPVIYTHQHWWDRCVGDKGDFKDYPLWMAESTSGMFNLPVGFSTYKFWQYGHSAELEGSEDYWYGDVASLRRFANK